MSDDPIRSGEFNSAMEMLRQSIMRIEQQSEKRHDATDRRIEGLYGLHADCTLRKEGRAFSDGMEAGKIESLSSRIDDLESDRKNTIAFRRTIMVGVLTSLLGSIFSILHKSNSLK